MSDRWVDLDKDDVAVISAAVTAFSVAGGGAIILADIIRLSPRIADFVTFADFFRRLPSVFAIVFFYALLSMMVAGLGSKLSEPLRRGATMVSICLSVGLIGFGSELATMSGAPDPLIDGARFLLYVVASAGVVSLIPTPSRQAAVGGLCAVFGVVLWLALFWRPLDAPLVLSDAVCAPDCEATQVLRVYGGWVLHRPARDRLVFQELDDVARIEFAPGGSLLRP